MRKDIPYLALELLFGGASAHTLRDWFNMVVDYVYTNSPILIRSRNLSAPHHMTALLEELHSATMRNTRCATAFLPTMLETMRQNPNLGNLKLVVVSWDSRHIKTQHSSSFDFQKRSYSSKIGNNAIVKLAATGADSVQRFIFMTTASTSPSNTDEAMASFLLDFETNQGKHKHKPFTEAFRVVLTWVVNVKLFLILTLVARLT